MTNRLLSPKHELFAQALAAGKTATDAYVEAGYSPSQPGAARLFSKPEIQHRLMEIQSEAAGEVVETIVDLVRQLNEVRVLAIKKGQAAAAATCIMGKAKLLGFLTDRVELDVRHQYADLSDEELDRELQEALAGSPPMIIAH